MADTVQAEVLDWPVEHVRQESQVAELSVVEKVVPAAQATHVASAEVVHEVPIFCPATHLVQRVGEVELAGQKFTPNEQVEGTRAVGSPQ